MEWLVLAAVVALILWGANADAGPESEGAIVPAGSGGGAGYAINNPGNLEPLPAGSGTWDGQTGTYQAGSQIIAVFGTLAEGIEANAVNAITHISRQPNMTYAQFADSWSGVVDVSYENALAQGAGVDPDQAIGQITAPVMENLLTGLFFAETGQSGGATPAQIAAGVAAALAKKGYSL